MGQNLSTIIVANTILAIGYIIDFVVGFKYNDKKTIIRFNLLSSSCSMMSNMILCAWGGAVDTIVTMARLIVIYAKEKFNKKWYFLFAVFAFLYTTSLFDWRGIYSILLFAGALCSFVPKWFSKNVQMLRLGALFHCVLVIPYFITFRLYTGVFFLTFSIVTTSINLFKWWREEKYKET